MTIGAKKPPIVCASFIMNRIGPKNAGGGHRIDLRPGSDYQRFVETYMEPLGDYGVWEVLFPNRISATSAQAIDEALHLLGDSKLVDRIFSDDIITVNKLIQSIKKKRAKYLEM